MSPTDPQPPPVRTAHDEDRTAKRIASASTHGLAGSAIVHLSVDRDVIVGRTDQRLRYPFSKTSIPTDSLISRVHAILRFDGVGVCRQKQNGIIYVAGARDKLVPIPRRMTSHWAASADTN